MSFDIDAGCSWRDATEQDLQYWSAREVIDRHGLKRLKSRTHDIIYSQLFDLSVLRTDRNTGRSEARTEAFLKQYAAGEYRI